ncbi:platelet basic protein-like [Dipodomys merriami]|uniref:platelet basic protein-like n=1 Tax=Dipodomys merriami TaxID=94247 RepID=UPI003855E10F
MTHKVDASASCPSVSPLQLIHVLLLLSVFLSMLVPSTFGYDEGDIEEYMELRCICVKTLPGIHPSKIQSVEVIQPGPHCDKVQVIATLKDGRKFCLDPKVLTNKKMLQNMLRGHKSAV